MIANKISNPNISPVGTQNKLSPGVLNSKDDSFKKLLDQTTSDVTAPAGAPAILPTSSDDAKLSATQLKFSGHAIDRMKSRGISFAPEQLKSIQDAIAKAAEKGSKDTLVLSGDSALIVSVKNNTVVTVMDKALMKDNVFTNIDSTIVL